MLYTPASLAQIFHTHYRFIFIRHLTRGVEKQTKITLASGNSYTHTHTEKLPQLSVPAGCKLTRKDVCVCVVQNAAARVLTRTRKYDHVSLVLSTLHWLHIKHRIDFKTVLITYKAPNGLAPQYLSEVLSHYSLPHPLRSQNSGHFIIPRISADPFSI